MRSVLPWSFSSYNAYQTCPRQFYEMKIAKNFPETYGEAVIWGNDVHKAIELNIKDAAPVPITMQRFMPIVNQIVNAPGETYAEVELACTIGLEATGFWSDDAWCRGKGDILKVNGTSAFAGDWKTGKVKPTLLQLDLMAVLTFAKFPVVEKVGAAFIWFQQPSKPTVKRFTRDQIPIVMEQFAQGVADMQYSQEHNVWPEKPSGLCRQWCGVKTCKYYQKGASYGRR